MDDIKNKTHHIAVTGIIRNNEGKFLICKRSPNEKAFPNKWCVPGGSLEANDFINTPKDTSEHWFDVIEKVLHREIKEETGIKIKSINYVSNLAFIHPISGFPTIIISLSGEHEDGEVKLKEDELVEHAWVDLNEAKDYDLIENIFEQIQKVDQMFQMRE